MPNQFLPIYPRFITEGQNPITKKMHPIPACLLIRHERKTLHTLKEIKHSQRVRLWMQTSFKRLAPKTSVHQRFVVGAG